MRRTPSDLALVISGRDDPMWPFLLEACSRPEAEAIRLFATDDPRSCRCTYDPRLGTSTFWIGPERIEGSQIGAVWFRRLPPPNLAHFDRELQLYCGNEHEAFIEGLEEGLPRARWISRPSAIRRARNKALQLRLATELGFDVPPTYFTNNPSTVVSSAQAGLSIFKTIRSPRVPTSPSRQTTAFTTLLTHEHLQAADGVLSCPGIVQEFCDKAADVRVTVFGKALFAVRIDSQANVRSRVDFRADARQLAHTPCTLSPDTTSRCLRLVADLNLEYAAIDLALQADGSVFFFEINPNGQWGWIEERTRLPLRRALLDLLFAPH